ncbi:hypothetical protein O6H91_05G120900 [Diphasiastrum complanatum]|nr:hypothetical protein O6H91_05G120900 [Diphasiastrum complanatum]KAJ7557293.1 hypothetical protein O6H91_05G120900 [Diphasiastrum complanatum]KAJ7557294.1 hypothetical protein O6H91_05G120900 [Diphasiastrum complanatum]KAJ7557295.1 hypothetical protein O6H91_05G120900 [Diphasiastrum complanatum]KAJ7557297.1 hypothetical protein O6H91_05G120900 [Diphasiastrum complanatum]
MQAAVQAGITSPRALVGPSCQQAKHSADNAQILPLAVSNGKKRKRVDQNLEPSKRGQMVKPEDSESNINKQDCGMKEEGISAIMDKDGAILNLACVDKLILLMEQELTDGVKTLADLASRRSMLAGVITATDREDCLNRFVQLGGLRVLDEWLQEAHRSKVVDGGSPKDGEKFFEDLLLILLCALDKLPVDLDALKTCVVGKSVNNLRSHKNFEVQRKARKLVDVWKRRVEVEMKQSGDSKVGPAMPWSCKQHPTDSLNSHSIKNGGSSDVAVRCSGDLISSAKAASSGSGNSSDGVSNHPALVPTLVKAPTLFSSSLPGNKDSCKLPGSNLSSDVSDKEDKRNCSSHSQNHVSHCSNVSVKISSSALLNSKIYNSESCSPGIICKGSVGPPALHGSQKPVVEKPLAWSRAIPISGDKLVPTAALSDKDSCEAGNMEYPDSQRSVVRLPNPVQVPSHVIDSRTVTCVSPNLQDKIAPLVTSDVSEGKVRPDSNPSTRTNSEVNSIPRGCNIGILIADGDTDHHSFTTLAKDTNKGDKLCHITNLCQSADGKCISKEMYLPVGIPSGKGVLAQRISTEGFTEADFSSKGENALQITRAAEGTSVQPEITGMGMNDGSTDLLTKGFAGQTVTSQGIDCALTSDTVRAEQGAGPREVQGGCAVAANLQLHSEHKVHVNGCREEKPGVDIESSEYMSNSPSPASSSSGNNQSIESSRSKVKVASKERANGEVQKSVSGRASGEDGDALEEKSSTGALSIERDIRSLEHLVKVNYGSPTETREVADARGMEVDEYNKAASQLHETNAMNLGSMNRESDSGSGDSDGTGSEKSLRLIQNLASDLEQFMGMSSESHAGGMESVSGSSEEDALELARQVAKEVEQEMGRYSKPLGSTSSDMEMQDTNLLSTHESAETTINNLDLVKENRWGPDYELGGKINTDPADQSDIPTLGCAHNQKLINEQEEPTTEKVSGSGSGEGALQSVSRTGVSSAIVAAVIDGAESNVQEVEGSNHAHTLNGSVELEISGTSSRTMQPVGTTSFTTPSLSGSSGSVVDFDGAKLSELNLPSVDPNQPQKARVSVAGKDAVERPLFDLNEGFITDEGMQEELTSTISACVSAYVNTPIVNSIASNALAAPIAVIASTNATFIPPASPVPINKDFGWKGSAATSAFRPAEPRRASEIQNSTGETILSDPNRVSTAKHVRAPLGIDLNVADDGSTEDIGLPIDGSEGSATTKVNEQATSLLFTNVSAARSTNGGLISSALQPIAHVTTWPDFDLNQADESEERKIMLMAESRVTENPASLKPHVTCSFRNTVRDFDLNDGPVASFEEIVALDEPVQQHSSASIGISSTPTVSGLRITPDIVNVAPWFSPGHSFPAVRIPTFSGARAESPYPVASVQPFLGTGIGLTPFGTDIFRTVPALTSSPAMSFPAAPPGPYPYPAFPFGGGFTFGSTSFGTTAMYGDTASSASFSSVTSQRVNSGGIPPSFVQPPYLTGLPEGAGTDSSRAWARLNFDLNAGPDPVDLEAARDVLNVRNPFTLSNQQTGDFCQVGASSGPFKRKGPEGSWEAHKRGYKHPTWR